MYNDILFDLDGTLVNSRAGIVSSVKYSLDKLGLSLSSDEVLDTFIGPPLVDSYKRVFGLSDEDAKEAVRIYREYYAPYGKNECCVYDGIPELLNKLVECGKNLRVATSKPLKFSSEILKSLGIEEYFTSVCGAGFDGKLDKKEDIIAHILETEPEIDVEKTLMVGDTVFDVEGARKNGIRAVAVTYGFGTVSSIASARPFAIVKTVEELGEMLIRL